MTAFPFWILAAVAGLAAEPPAKEPPAQQRISGIRIETFENGKALPLGQAEIRRPEGKPPTIVYPKSRSSTGWIEKDGATRVAVAEGLEWDGKVAYLSLTFDLAVTDAKTKKTLWTAPVGAFWDTITFENLAKPTEPARWALALRSTAKPEFQQNYDLQTGEKLELTGGPATPAGKPFTPRKSWSGSRGVRAESAYRLVSSIAEWQKLRGELFGNALVDAPYEGDKDFVDFTKETLLVCYGGKATNWNGIGVELAVEDDDRLLVRLKRATYQSLGESPEEHPYGFFILPKRPGKPVILEFNMQRYIGGPPIWKEFARLGGKAQE